MGDARFYARYSSVSPEFDDGAYLRPVAAFPSNPHKEGQLLIAAWLTVEGPGNRTQLARSRARRLDPAGASVF